MDEKQRLLRLTEKAARYRAARRPAAIGELLRGYMENRVRPRQQDFAIVKEAWDQVVPAAMAGVCRLGDVENGRVRVLVGSPPYRYQLQMCAGELLKELQNRCGRKTVRQIKFELG